MPATKVYLLPGLGLDHNIFQRLKIQAAEHHYLDWIVPEEQESIQSYAQRLAAPLQDDPRSAVLIGHSFGGIMAQEIANRLPVRKVIIISSIKSPQENPTRFKMLSLLGLHRYFSKELTLRTFPFWATSFGYPDSDSQRLFTASVARQDNRYLQWALQQLSNWQGIDNTLIDLAHLHGEEDRTFPIGLIRQPVTIVKGAGHLMLFHRAEEISSLINELLL
ncbi:MAG: alpha/beta hydrolase [Bacteroidota bacterium]